MKIITNPDIEILKEDAGAALARLLSDASTNRPILLLLSGGSAFDILSSCALPETTLGFTVMMLDERFSEKREENNFYIFSQTDFYARIKKAGATLVNTESAPEKTVEDLAQKMNDTLLRWEEEHPEGKIFATLGIGADGHTAGIMPYPENPELFENLFTDEKRVVVGYDAGTKNPIPLRATVTIPFLKNRIDAGIVYAVGASKQAAFEKIRSEKGSLAETPARILREMREVTLFTDVI